MLNKRNSINLYDLKWNYDTDACDEPEHCFGPFRALMPVHYELNGTFRLTTYPE